MTEASAETVPIEDHAQRPIYDHLFWPGTRVCAFTAAIVVGAQPFELPGNFRFFSLALLVYAAMAWLFFWGERQEGFRRAHRSVEPADAATGSARTQDRAWST